MRESKENPPAKLKAETYLPPDLYDKIFRDLKPRWEKLTGQEIKDSPFLAMIVKEGAKTFRKRLEKLEAKSSGNARGNPR